MAVLLVIAVGVTESKEHNIFRSLCMVGAVAVMLHLEELSGSEVQHHRMFEPFAQCV